MPRPVTTPFEGFPVGFDRLYGLEVLDIGEEEARAQVKVRDELRQPAGLVHGGVFASIAETLASMATWLAVHEDGKTAQGLSNQTSFLRPIVDGTIHATARRRHRGRTTWVWEVDITDDQDRLCALVRMTVAVSRARVATRRGFRPLGEHPQGILALGPVPRAPRPVGVGDRHPPVAPERARRDLDAGRRLAALVLGAVDEREHALDRVGRQPGALELLAVRSSST